MKIPPPLCIAYRTHPFLKFCPHTPNPTFLSPPTPTATVFSVVMFLWQKGWSCHIWCATLLNDNMDLYVPSLGTLVPEGSWCVFHATRRQVYWSLKHTVVFYWYCYLISVTHNIQNTFRGHETKTHINIYLHHLLCGHSSYLYLIKWLNE